MAIPNYKIIVAGDAGVGKTTYIKRLLEGVFMKNYVATLGVDVFVLSVNTNYGKIILDIWDTAGQERFKGLGPGYFTYSDGAIVMFDTTSKISFKNVNSWTSNIITENKGNNIPIVICGNKFDLEREAIGVRTKYPKISCRSCYNLYGPIVDILRKITGHEDLVQVVDVEEESKQL